MRHSGPPLDGLQPCSAAGSRRGRLVGNRPAEQGAAAVELALVLPLLLLLVCGIIDLGRLLDVQITLSAAAREGARWAALGQTGVPGRVSAAAPGLTPTTSATGCPTPAAVGVNATVIATTSYTPLTPLSTIAGLFGGTFPSSITLTGQGVMRCGG